jgi:glucose/arabinose dehydrogenase
MTCKARREVSEVLASNAPALVAPAGPYRIQSDFLCDSMPRAMIETMKGYCVGIAAMENKTWQGDGLVQSTGSAAMKFPRNIRQYDDTNGIQRFLVTDMGGWVPAAGSLWLLIFDKAKKETHLTQLLSKLEQPHGIEIDGNTVYLGFLNRIDAYQFDPGQNKIVGNGKTLISNMPGKDNDQLARDLARQSDSGTRVRNNHPLKNFIFSPDKKFFYVNVGAPDDACQNYKKTGECNKWVTNRYATLYKIPVPPFNISAPVDLLGEAVPVAHGLRNSMALAFRDQDLFQGENSTDISDQFVPFEEINVITETPAAPIPFYGWPYCYDNSATKQSEFVGNAVCARPDYHKPATLMPPHVAPLGMVYYPKQGAIEELRDTLIVTWHGHQPQGSKLVYYQFDHDKLKTDTAPVTYQFPEVGGDYADRKIVQKKIEPDSTTSPQAQQLELISRWEAVDCTRPKGTPVGITMASDGAIWIIEDKNKTILRLTKTSDPAVTGTDLPIDKDNPCHKSADGKKIAKLSEDRAELMRRLTMQNPAQAKIFDELLQIFAKGACTGPGCNPPPEAEASGACNACHSANHAAFLKPTGEIDSSAFAQHLLTKDGFVEPGLPEESFLYQIISGTNPQGRVMPPDGRFVCKNPAEAGVAKRLREWIDSLYPHDSATEHFPDLRYRFTGSVLSVRAKPGDDRADVAKCGTLMGADQPVFKVRKVAASDVEARSGFKDWSEIYISAGRAKKMGIDISEECGGKVGVYYIANVPGLKPVDAASVPYCQ